MGFIASLKRKMFRAYYSSKVKSSCGSFKGKIVVNGKSSIGKNVHLGNNVHFNGMNIPSGAEVIIGDNFHSGKDCIIITKYHNYNGEKLPYDNTYIYKNVIIGDNVWLGNRVLILGGVEIGEGAIIQAGAVVVKSIPPLAIAGGNPATVFKYRDSAHYERLKSIKKFH